MKYSISNAATLDFAFISSTFLTRPKSQDKNVDILRTKKPFNMKKKKRFSLFSKGFQLSEIVSGWTFKIMFLSCHVSVEIKLILIRHGAVVLVS